MIKQFEVGKSYYREIPSNPSFTLIKELEKELQELKSAAINVYHIVQNAKDPDDHIKNLRSLIFSEKK